ncbi:hypothetical protein HMPREF2792_11485 [Corynebacterium sp. HMSC068H04]|uniref:DUF3037 domain-containing protein n=1 Tax=Corynebacterium sp. HMSC068H04 TaxID=1739296 RepID=UPI0008A1A271|nr:DUF3037 domain-containing protein [Corynebacterium sp. HMSC068H04]OFK93168.1 hypothetical protein HMPREF2792_11485 [Corynebacterium sp. HMSC068H04]
MRFDYWTVSVVPRPMGITTIGVGVIVIDAATGETKNHFRSDRGIHHDSDFPEAIRRALQHFKADLKKLTTTTEPLNLDGQHTLSSYLEFISGHWNNLIKVHPMQSMDAANLNEATDLLFSTLIGEAPTGKHQQDVRQVRRFIRKQYEQLPSLEKATIFDADVQVARRELDLTLAVVDDEEVIELNQAFNFRSSDANITRAAIDSWTLKVDKLQQAGGELTAGETLISIPRELDIVAVTTLPNSSAQKKNYQQFREFCGDLDISMLTMEEIPQHAASLNRRLAS